MSCFKAKPTIKGAKLKLTKGKSIVLKEISSAGNKEDDWIFQIAKTH